jgi:NADH:ubiquinone oxidoreductase subunit 6 (subunit J)
MDLSQTIYALSFYGLAFFAVAAAIVVISARHAVISAIWLAVCFIAVAGIYVLLKAPFLAMVQILVYAGAIMVLFVMIVMLMDVGKLEPGTVWRSLIRAFGALAGVLVTFILAFWGSQAYRYRWSLYEVVPTGTIETIGGELFTKYLMPFEAVTLLLITAVVAAIYLARRPEGKE